MIIDLMLLFVYLLMSKTRKIRRVSMCLFVAHFIFIFCVDVIGVSGDTRFYMVMLIGLYLGHEIIGDYFALAITCYMLIPVSFLGWQFYNAGKDPGIYVTLCSIITTIQICMIIYRAKKDAIIRCFKLCFRLSIFCLGHIVGGKPGDCSHQEKAQ